ncbi:MAG: hypothetical protein N2450_01185 [bacterium]|nr:hypothetical protein [bacterium]
MVTQRQMKNWLSKKGFVEEKENFYCSNSECYELQPDFYRFYRRDAMKRYFLIKIVSYVDLFEDQDGEIKDKWHFVLGKNMAPTYFTEHFDPIPWKPK